MMKEVDVKVHQIIFDLMVIIIGRMMAISMSKIKNKIAIMKNWMENGIRDDLWGSNPHSKGDIFSRS